MPRDDRWISKPDEFTQQEHNAIACARETTYAARCPLRNLKGFAARDRDILKMLRIISEFEDDKEAAFDLALAVATEEIEIAGEAGEPADREYSLAIVQAIRWDKQRKTMARGLTDITLLGDKGSRVWRQTLGHPGNWIEHFVEPMTIWGVVVISA